MPIVLCHTNMSEDLERILGELKHEYLHILEMQQWTDRLNPYAGPNYLSCEQLPIIIKKSSFSWKFCPKSINRQSAYVYVWWTKNVWLQCLRDIAGQKLMDAIYGLIFNTNICIALNRFLSMATTLRFPYFLTLIVSGCRCSL